LRQRAGMTSRGWPRQARDERLVLGDSRRMYERLSEFPPQDGCEICTLGEPSAAGTGGVLVMHQAHSDFGRVYAAHVWHVYGFLAYRVGEREMAEDLTQETFERALRAWSRFDPRRASERTWLLAIARNGLIDHRRKRRASEVPAERTGTTIVQGPEQRYSGSPNLDEALSHLPDRDREILALRYGGDLAGAEIAALLGLSLANVQQVLSRSLRKLRELLGERYTTPAPTSPPRATSSKPTTR
jgi:RNA polymerase sigma-70 factor, ECF subfamily